MKEGLPFDSLHNAIAHATYEAYGDIEYESIDWEHKHKTGEKKMVNKTRPHSVYDLAVEAVFLQAWGSTALGFGGIGGQAITTAYTIILRSDQADGYCVYFNGRFAYKIDRPNRQFFEDMHNFNMCEVARAKKRYEEVKNDDPN